MEAQDDFYRSILDHLPEGVYFVDRQRRITFWSKGAERITGYTAAEVAGRRCADNLLMHVDGAGQLLCGASCPVLATMTNGTPHEAQVFLHHADGHRVPVLVRAAPLFDAGGRVVGAVESFSDNSPMMAALERVRELDDAAFRDALTGIGNRRLLDLRIDTLLNEVRLQRHAAGILFVDIDGFKAINDRHGHDVGDRVLVMVARTLAANLRASDVIGRWGGEEFLALLPGVEQAMLGELANKLGHLVAASSITVAGMPLAVTVSIGASVVRADDTPAMLVARADRLMYAAKQAGRNRVACEGPVPTR
jgi:diguanylate cyclase (GGDEF)-like protein/PAS domain S-box-containing protein